MRNQCIMVTFCAGLALAGSAMADVVYDGRGGWTGSNATLLNATEWADDLHLTDAGKLTSFSVEYFQSTSSTLTVRFYSNNATNTLYPEAATLLATYSGIPVVGGGGGGTATYNIPVLDQVDLPEHVWMSVSFNAQAFLRLQGSAAVGSSDIHRTTVPGFGDYNFDWPGNFPFVVNADPVPAPGAAGIMLTAAACILTRRRR